MSTQALQSILDEVKSEVAAAAKARQQRLIVYVVVAVAFAGYLAWAYSKVKPFTDPVYVAETMVEIGRNQVPDLIDQGAQQLVQSSPDIVASLETQALDIVPALRLQLQLQLEQSMTEAVTAVMAPHDALFVKRLSANPKLALDALAGPDGTKAFEALLSEKVKASDKTIPSKLMVDAEAQLTKVRDRVRKLQQNKDLNAVEKSERRLLVALLSQLQLPVDPPSVAQRVASEKAAAKPAGKKR